MTRKQLQRKIDKLTTELELLFKRVRKNKKRLSNDEYVELELHAIRLHNERAELLWKKWNPNYL